MLLIFGLSPEAEAPEEEEEEEAEAATGTSVVGVIAMVSGLFSSTRLLLLLLLLMMVLVCASDDASALSKFLERFLTLELPTREWFAGLTEEETETEGDGEGDVAAVVAGVRFFLSVVGGDEGNGLSAPPLLDILRVTCSVSC